MALSRICCRRPSLLALCCRRPHSSDAVTKPPLRTRLLEFFTRFYDVQMLLSWTSKSKNRKIRKKNIYYGFAEEQHGPNVSAAYFILNLNGGFRYCGQSDWFRAEKFDWDFVNHKDSQLEEIDLSYSVINFEGLWNLEDQKSLRTLSLKGCPEVNGWFLSRLHVFQDSLEELDISHCPKITIGDLAALRNLKGLRRLDVSSLPAVSNPGLVVILLEEMLPECHVTATGYEFDLPAKEKEEDDDDDEGQKEERQR